MAENYYDRASRLLATLDPPAFLGWLLNLDPADFVFRGWLDTRGVPLPSGTDRTADTVAHVADVSAHGVPWAVVIEFQIQPDADMFGRLLEYLSSIYRHRRPDDERGSRFHLGAAVVNLTGGGLASRDMHWPAAGLRTQLTVAERNLEREPAADLLAGLEAGRWSPALLPWLPLMAGGDDADLIDRWKVLAGGEPDRRRRDQFATIALLFAARLNREAVWKQKLEDWNVEENAYISEWVAVGEKRGEARGVALGEVRQSHQLILKLGAKQLGAAPADVEATLRAIQDRGRLDRIAERVLDAADWTDLLATV